MSQSPFSRYRLLLDQCELSPDAGQEALVMALQELFTELNAESFLSRENKRFSSLFKQKSRRLETHGLYIWGGVGRGKSMLMDLFFDVLPFQQKKRIHFHAFMREVHARIHELRKEEATFDPLLIVANEIAKETYVLCFDEFQVHDVADAMILSRLFSELFDKGVVVIFTSNRPPEDLYLNGLQRERFLPFIQLVEQKMTVHEIASDTDYRLRNMEALDSTYFTPLGVEADHWTQEQFAALTHHAMSQATTLEVQGRQLVIEKTYGDVAWVTFEELCAMALGASDYLEIAVNFRTILMQDIPILSPEKRNEAKRFVTFIDVAYEHKLFFLCSAAASPEQLYPKGDGSFEFERTVSRLIEMQSEEYTKEASLAERG